MPFVPAVTRISDLVVARTQQRLKQRLRRDAGLGRLLIDTAGADRMFQASTTRTTIRATIRTTCRADENGPEIFHNVATETAGWLDRWVHPVSMIGIEGRSCRTREPYGAVREAIKGWRGDEAIVERPQQPTRVCLLGCPADVGRRRPPTEVALA